MAGRRIVIEFLGKDVSAGKTADQVSGKFGKLDGKFSSLSDGAKRLMGAAGFAGLGASVVKFGQQASDLGETQSKIRQIFKGDTVAITQLGNAAKQAAEDMGMSQQAYLDAAATFGIIGKGAGLAGPKLQGFSQKMVSLAGDMASFNNATPQEAIEAIGAAMRGEAEPIRRFGVLLNDDALKAEAMSMGLLKASKDAAKIGSAQATLLNAQKKYNEAVKEHGEESLEAVTAQARLGSAQSALKKATEGTVGPLTQQQKVLASQSLILKQTKDQQGDFAKTSDGLANKQRILKAEFENATTQLGEKMLPIMLKVTDAGGKLLDWTKKHSTATKVIAGVLAALVGTLYLVSKAMAAVNLVMSLNPIGAVILAVAALGVALVVAYKKSETFRKIVDGAFRATANAVKFMWDGVIKPAFRMWVNTWLTVVGAMVNGAAKAFGWVPKLGPKLQAAAANFNDFKTDVNKALDGTKDKKKITVSTPGADTAISNLRTIKQLMKDISSAKPMKVPKKGGLDVLLNPGRNAKGTNSWRGGPTWLHEQGPEIVDLPRGSRVIPAGLSRSIARRGGGGEGDVAYATINLNLDGRQVQQVLLKLKRTNGGLQLGLA